MFEQKKLIKDVSYFIVNEKYLVYKTKNKNVICQEILDKNIGDDIILTRHNIFYNKEENIYAINLLDYSKKKIKNYAIFNVEPMCFDKGIVINSNYEKLYFLDKKTFSLKKLNINNYNWGLIYLTADFVFINNINNVQAFLLKENTLLWQFDLTTLGTYTDYNNETQNYKVEKILGIHNECLYLGLSGSLIVELDIATGDITYQWHKLPKQFVKHPSDGFSARLFDLDTENNQLICIAGRRYDTIDLDTKTYNSVDTTKELEQYDIVSITRQGDFTNEHISAIAHLKNDTWMQEGIVMFNRKTNRIDFFYKDKTFTTGTDKPKIAGDKLYQLDVDSNLHIFEKTGDNQV